jgi:hypothetical protein
MTSAAGPDAQARLSGGNLQKYIMAAIMQQLKLLIVAQLTWATSAPRRSSAGVDRPAHRTAILVAPRSRRASRSATASRSSPGGCRRPADRRHQRREIGV